MNTPIRVKPPMTTEEQRDMILNILVDLLLDDIAEYIRHLGFDIQGLGDTRLRQTGENVATVAASGRISQILDTPLPTSENNPQVLEPRALRLAFAACCTSDWFQGLPTFAAIRLNWQNADKG